MTDRADHDREDAKVTPLRATLRNKEARLARMRRRFENAHPLAPPPRRQGLSVKLLVLAFALAAAMAWLALLIAR